MDKFLDELERLRQQHQAEFLNLPFDYSPKLVERIVSWVRAQQQAGQTVLKSCVELRIPLSQLRRWLYPPRRRNREERIGGLRPVRVSAEQVVVHDGVPERRFTVCSPAGWTVRDLTLRELTELFRSLV